MGRDSSLSLWSGLRFRGLGARPLRRAVQRLIEDPLAEEVLRGTFRAGDTILAYIEEGKIAFRAKPIDEGMPGGMSLDTLDGELSDDTGLPPLEEPAALS